MGAPARRRGWRRLKARDQRIVFSLGRYVDDHDPTDGLDQSLTLHSGGDTVGTGDEFDSEPLSSSTLPWSNSRIRLPALRAGVLDQVVQVPLRAEHGGLGTNDPPRLPAAEVHRPDVDSRTGTKQSGRDTHPADLRPPQRRRPKEVTNSHACEVAISAIRRARSTSALTAATPTSKPRLAQ